MLNILLHILFNIIFTLNIELQKLDVWLQANILTLNTAKTHYYGLSSRENKI